MPSTHDFVINSPTVSSPVHAHLMAREKLTPSQVRRLEAALDMETAFAALWQNGVDGGPSLEREDRSQWSQDQLDLFRAHGGPLTRCVGGRIWSKSTFNKCSHCRSNRPSNCHFPYRVFLDRERRIVGELAWWEAVVRLTGPTQIQVRHGWLYDIRREFDLIGDGEAVLNIFLHGVFTKIRTTSDKLVANKMDTTHALRTERMKFYVQHHDLPGNFNRNDPDEVNQLMYDVETKIIDRAYDECLHRLIDGELLKLYL